MQALGTRRSQIVRDNNNGLFRGLYLSCPTGDTGRVLGKPFHKVFSQRRDKPFLKVRPGAHQFYLGNMSIGLELEVFLKTTAFLFLDTLVVEYLPGL